MAAFTSGAKIFAICPEEAEESDIGKLTFYPIGVDWETLFKWYFRVKTWKAEYSYNFNASVTVNGTSANVTAPSPSSVDSTTNVEDESQFTCKTPAIRNQLDSIEEDDSNESPDAIVNANITSLSGGAISQFLTFKTLYIGDTFYPYLRIQFNIATLAAGSGSDGTANANAILYSTPNVSTDPEYSQVDIPIEIDGEIGVIQWTYYKTVFNEGDATSDVNLIITNLKLTPEEYWEYDFGEGPMYDSTNGDVLIDPWSYQP